MARGSMRGLRTRSRSCDYRWRRKRRNGRTRCFAGRRNCYLLLVRLRLLRLGQNEGGFAGLLQLQLLANFHVLLAAALLKAVNLLLAALIFAACLVVAVFQFANLPALFEKG